MRYFNLCVYFFLNLLMFFSSNSALSTAHKGKNISWFDGYRFDPPLSSAILMAKSTGSLRIGCDRLICSLEATNILLAQLREYDGDLKLVFHSSLNHDSLRALEAIRTKKNISIQTLSVIVSQKFASLAGIEENEIDSKAIWEAIPRGLPVERLEVYGFGADIDFEALASILTASPITKFVPKLPHLLGEYIENLSQIDHSQIEIELRLESGELVPWTKQNGIARIELSQDSYDESCFGEALEKILTNNKHCLRKLEARNLTKTSFKISAAALPSLRELEELILSAINVGDSTFGPAAELLLVSFVADSPKLRYFSINKVSSDAFKALLAELTKRRVYIPSFSMYLKDFTALNAGASNMSASPYRFEVEINANRIAVHASLENELQSEQVKDIRIAINDVSASFLKDLNFANFSTLTSLYVKGVQLSCREGYQLLQSIGTSLVDLTIDNLEHKIDAATAHALVKVMNRSPSLREVRIKSKITETALQILESKDLVTFISTN